MTIHDILHRGRVRSKRSARAVLFTVLFITAVLAGGATASAKTYSITPKSKPCIKKIWKHYHTYNKKTKNYYAIQSYMQKFEKAGGGTLILKKGTYKITNSIYVPSNVTIVLQDGVKLTKAGKTGVKDMPAASAMFMLCPPSKGHKKGSVGGYNGTHDVTIRGEGNAVIDMKYLKGKKGGHSLGIDGTHNQNITISGINFRNINNGHFIEMDATKNALITDCTFTGSKGSLVREAINLDTPDKTTGGFSARFSNFDKTADDSITISNCTFTDLARGVGTHNYSEGHPHTNIHVTGCTFNNIAVYAVKCMLWQNSSVENCSFTGTTDTFNGAPAATDKGDPYACAVQGEGVTGFVVRNCTVTNFYQAFMIKGRDEGSSNQYAAITSVLTPEEISEYTDTNRIISGVANPNLMYFGEGSVKWVRYPVTGIRAQ